MPRVSHRPHASMDSRQLLARIRLGSGLVLFAYVTLHLLVHALGLISLEAMEAGRRGMLVLWRNPVGSAALYGSLFGHVLTALFRIYERRTLRMQAWELVQIGLTFFMPFTLLAHMAWTRGIASLGVEDTYFRTLSFLWPRHAVGQSILLLTVWVHGCLGIHFWLKFRPWYRSLHLPLYTLALLIMVFALMGFAVQGRHLTQREAQGELQRWVPEPAVVRTVEGWRDKSLQVFGILVGVVLVGRGIRQLWARRRGSVRLSFPGRVVSAPVGPTLLEVSRRARIPVVSLCGGRGRCSTCRTRIGEGLTQLPPPSEQEARVLRQIAAPENVRLACQVRPTADLTVTPLVPPGLSRRDAWLRSQEGGMEREIVILFADLRGFTRFSEKKLPYDVVFVLNRYFRAMGEAIESAGGRVDKFIGDGVMALFALQADSATGCRQALAAAKAMAMAMERLNQELAQELAEPLRMGIGIHTGSAIVGELGFGPATQLTAIGDAVNMASRLESKTAEFGVQLVVSVAVEERAGLELTAFPQQEIPIRGRNEKVIVRMVADARELPVQAPEREEARGRGRAAPAA